MSSQNQIHVLSIDSNEESRLAVQDFFKGKSDLILAAQARNAAETLERLQERTIDVVLLDLGLEGTDGIELTRQIRQQHQTVKVLIFTASHTPDDIFAAMDAGADGYVLKGNVTEALEIAIRSVRLGAVWLDPGIARQVLQAMQLHAAQPSRVLPTGVMTIPLLPDERSILNDVAASNCVDGVCMVDPDFVRKLRRFSHSSDSLHI